MNASSAIIAIDVGGTGIQGAIIRQTGQITDALERPTPREENIGAITEVMMALLSVARKRGQKVSAVGVVTPGVVDETAGVVAYAADLGWQDVPLAQILHNHAGLPIYVGHDVRSAGLAERTLGGSEESGELLYVMIGTGIAAAVLTGDRPISGATNSAGEFGHIPVVPHGEVCPCGQQGCLAVYASGAGIARRYAARGGQPFSARTIAGRVGSDPLAATVWDEGMQALARGLTIATLILDPGRIVIGGGFAKAGRVLLEPVTCHLQQSLTWRSAPAVEISSLGSETGVLGAAMMAFARSGNPGVLTTWRARLHARGFFDASQPQAT